jgi:hypothetical protein
MDAAVLQAAAVYASVGRKLFSEQSGSNSSLHAVTPEEFENEQYRFSGFASTKVRMALALALMRQSVGNLDQARAFAKIGLASLTSTSALKSELERLCNTAD